MDFDYDVAIIGAGPVGSTIAYYLAQYNLNVVIIEKKTQIGHPLQCAGILSTHINDLNELPENIILNKVKGAYLHSKNYLLKVEKPDDVAYIIDRLKYDEHLFKRAINSNVNFINKKVSYVDINRGSIVLENNEIIISKIIVGCDGYNSTLSKAMNNHQNYFNATQFLVNINDIETYHNSSKNNDSYVDTYITEDLLPGFLWIIPIKNNQYRVGLFSNDSHKNQREYLMKFLDETFDYEIIERYKGFIPIFNEENLLVNKRAILIGDAASQIKPTSGGGLLMAFDACKLAIEPIINAVEKDDIELLKDYQNQFNKKYLKEINYQFRVQKTLNLFNDNGLDYLFLKLKNNNGEELISQYGDMDNQSILIKEILKKGLLFKLIPSFFIKKVLNIFEFR